MSVTEAQRLHLFKTFEGLLPEEDVATMMAMLPPGGWADVATTQDLTLLRAEMATIRAEMATKQDLQEQTTRFIGWMLASNTALAGVFGALLAFT